MARLKLVRGVTVLASFCKTAAAWPVDFRSDPAVGWGTRLANLSSLVSRSWAHWSRRDGMYVFPR